MAVIGIDLGTSSVKVVVLDARGQTLSTGKASYQVQAPQPGWAESDPEKWWLATVDAVHGAMQHLPQGEISAIGLAGQMHGVVLTNNEGVPVRPALLWADTRAYDELEHYRTLSDLTLRQLANPLVAGMAGPLLCWLAHYETSSYQTAQLALQPKDWLRLRLTDVAASDPSDASATLLYNLVDDCWFDEVIAKLGLRRTLFAELLPTSGLAGTLTSRAAEELGLPAGTPIATGAADTAAAALGTGLLTPGTLQLTLGTGAQLVQLTTEATPDPYGRTHLYRSADGATWYRMAAVQNAGLALDWVRRALAASWEEIYASAALVDPGTQGLTFLPYVTRERPYQQARQQHAAFLDMRIDHQREHLLHAALEGVAYNIRAALEALPETKSKSAIRLAGGGSIHPAWRQMLADIVGRDLLIVDTVDASARGAALLAGILSDIWSDAAATVSVAPSMQPVVHPDSHLVSAYDEAYRRYSGQ